MKKILLLLFALTATGCCDRISSDADELKTKHKKCRAGDTCVIVNMYDAAGDNNCLGAFQCSSSMNENNVARFPKEAKKLAEGYEHCSECTKARCAVTENHIPFCNEETGLCDTREPEEN